METRTNSPFPTEKCVDCETTIPTSRRSEYCATCENFRQVFGKDPSDVTSVKVQLRRTHLFGEVVNWRVEIMIDGERDIRKPFKKEKAKRLTREYQSIANAALG